MRSSDRGLAVLNPGGRDPEQDFHAPAEPDSAAHAPVNFHAYAACTGGAFHRDVTRAAAHRRVLLLLRGDLRASQRALRQSQAAGARVAVSLKETGLHQIAAQLTDAGRLSRFLKIVSEADGCIAPTPEAADIYRDVRRGHEGVVFIPTPYPLHDPGWDFSRPVEHRHGIFVGTREWDVPSRNHAAALLAARNVSDITGARVTVYNFDGRKGERLLAEIGFRPNRLRVMGRGNSYAEYLRIVAEHRVVLEMDTSFVPGQVAGDALLCRIPCVGGNGAVDRLGHSATCGAGRFGPELEQLATRLLVDAEFYTQTIAESQRNAAERLSFDGVAAQLEQFFTALPPTTAKHE
ncbi:MAG: hypothetical protein H0W20_06835 [Chthoniobacterales bacterium]|nr:hypothetical protein [Chthoniobacterales bacterium]